MKISKKRLIKIINEEVERFIESNRELILKESLTTPEKLKSLLYDSDRHKQKPGTDSLP